MRIAPSFALAIAIAFTASCKAKHADGVGSGSGSGSAPPLVAETTPIDASDANGLSFAPGETYFGGTRTTTNVQEWKTADGSVMTLVIVSTGKDADGRETGVLRVYRNGKAVPIGQAFALSTTGDHWAELKQLPNNRVLFRYGDNRDDRRARNAVLLQYDPNSGEVRIVKRWVGSAKAEEPAWVTSGEYKAPSGTTDQCAKIIARMVACKNDEAFRRSLGAREETDEQRASLLATFDKDLATWKTPADVKHQCERWGSDEYVETTFSETAKLEELAKDAGQPKLNCGLFGAEIVDEGGLPQLSRK